MGLPGKGRGTAGQGRAGGTDMQLLGMLGPTRNLVSLKLESNE